VPRIESLRFRVYGLGFEGSRVLGFRVRGWESRVKGSRLWGLGFRLQVQGLGSGGEGLRVEGLGYSVYSLAFRV
jgi:hypothetical protein